jgi:hypothetical protein
VASRYQKVFVFGGLGQRKLQALSNTEGIPVLGPDTFVQKNSFVPIPPAGNWGQEPVLEGVLPQGRLSQSRFEGDPLGFGCDEFVRIRNSHRTKEVGRRIGLSANQKLSGKLLREGGEEISGKN